MADPTYDDLIVGALLGDGATPERYQRARREIREQFLLPAHRRLYELAVRYFVWTGAPLDATGFAHIAAEADPVSKMALEQEFARLWQRPVEEAHFRYALRAVREKRRDERFVTGLSEAIRAFQSNGYGDGREALRKALAEIDRYYDSDHVEGNVWEDTAAVWQAYEEAKTTGGLDPRSIQTGIAEIDRRILALRPGENMLVAGYSSHGKTTMIQNIAWYVSTQMHRPVIIFTNENSYAQYRDRLYNRLSHLAVEGGLRHTDVRRGALAPTDEQALQRMLAGVPAAGYGDLYVVQMPRHASMEWVGAQMDRWADELDVGLMVLDYIGRMPPARAREKRRDELNDTIVAWTNALVDFGRGRGVPGITGYQTSREKMREAQLHGRYDLTCLAETSEAERNASVVATLLKQDDVESEVILQILKNRDGETMEPTPVQAVFATTLITSADRGGWLR